MDDRPTLTWLQRLKAQLQGSVRLSVEPQGLASRVGRKRDSIRWDEVEQIDIQKIEKITYDENFLILVRRDRSGFPLGELDEGFRHAIAAIEERFTDLPQGWEAFLNASDGPVSRRAIWQRKARR